MRPSVRPEAAPVPAHAPGPAPAPVVQYGPGSVPEGQDVVPDGDGARRGASRVLGGVLEAPVAPRDDHRKGLVPVRQRGEQVDLDWRPAGPQAARPQPGAARPFGDLDADPAAYGPLGSHDEGPRPRGAGDGVGQAHAAAAGHDRGPLELAPPAGPELQHVDGVQRQVVQVADGQGHQVRRCRDAPVLPPFGAAPARDRRAVQGPARPADRRGIERAVGSAQADRTGDLTFVRGHARTLCGRGRGGRGAACRLPAFRDRVP